MAREDPRFQKKFYKPDLDGGYLAIMKRSLDRGAITKEEYKTAVECYTNKTRYTVSYAVSFKSFAMGDSGFDGDSFA